MRVQFVGCGDAFGSGGRLNTCFHVTGERANFLIDCGASSLIGMKRLGIDRNAIDAILVTHFHGDHFGGLPFFMLEAQFVAKRARPLLIAGPPGLEDRYAQAMGAAFPGSALTSERFALAFRELEVEKANELGGLKVETFLMRHVAAAGPCLGLRIEVEGRVIAFSGDTEWTDALIPLGRDADLMICEAYTRDKPVKLHLALSQLEARLAEIHPKRLVLTHLGEDMLARRAEVPYQTAEDGLVIEL